MFWLSFLLQIIYIEGLLSYLDPYLLLHESCFTELELVNLLRSPGIDSQPGGPVRQPNLTYRPARLHDPYGQTPCSSASSNQKAADSTVYSVQVLYDPYGQTLFFYLLQSEGCWQYKYSMIPMFRLLALLPPPIRRMLTVQCTSTLWSLYSGSWLSFHLQPHGLEHCGEHRHKDDIHASHQGQVWHLLIQRVTKRDVVYLIWPIAPSYMSPNAGREGRGLSQWVQLCTRSPNKLWRCYSTFSLWFNPIQQKSVANWPNIWTLCYNIQWKSVNLHLVFL